MRRKMCDPRSTAFAIT